MSPVNIGLKYQWADDSVMVTDFLPSSSKPIQILWKYAENFDSTLSFQIETVYIDWLFKIFVGGYASVKSECHISICKSPNILIRLFENRTSPLKGGIMGCLQGHAGEMCIVRKKWFCRELFWEGPKHQVSSSKTEPRPNETSVGVHAVVWVLGRTWNNCSKLPCVSRCTADSSRKLGVRLG